MKISVIFDDDLVCFDGNPVKGFAARSSFAKQLHAIQFDEATSTGEVEFRDKDFMNAPINSLAKFADIIEPARAAFTRAREKAESAAAAEAAKKKG